MKVMKWIDVKKRLPPNDIYVLVAVWDGRSKTQMYSVCIKSRINKVWFDDANGDELDAKLGVVTHWMPCPDDPNEQRLVEVDDE